MTVVDRKITHIQSPEMDPYISESLLKLCSDKILWVIQDGDIHQINRTNAKVTEKA